jgi:hypothetical protein
MELSFRKRKIQAAKNQDNAEPALRLPKHVSEVMPLLNHLAELARGKLAEFQDKWAAYRWPFWQSLIFEQKCYVLATISFLFILFSNFELKNPLTYSPLLIALVGMLREFWPKFLVAWESLIGKTFILLFYAIMANFALAMAGGMVNDVAGVNSDLLPYAHNLALILSMPTWFVLSSTLALLVVQLLTPVYLVLLALIKILGHNYHWHPKEYRFAFTTAVFRLVWAFALLFVLMYVAFMSGIVSPQTPLLGKTYSVVLQGFDDAHEQSVKQNPPQDAPIDNSESLSIEVTGTSKRDMVQRSQEVYQKQLILIADFIYHYEADSRSRCEMPADTKVVELNDYQLLTIKLSTTNSIGYEYNVIACKSPGI